MENIDRYKQYNSIIFKGEKESSILDKGAQNMHWRKNSLFNKWCYIKLKPSLSPCTNINSKWSKDRNVKSEMMKLIQEKIVNTLDQICIGNNFMNRTPIAQQ
jgi:hypothetical protein